MNFREKKIYRGHHLEVKRRITSEDKLVTCKSSHPEKLCKKAIHKTLSHINKPLSNYNYSCNWTRVLVICKIVFWRSFSKCLAYKEKLCFYISFAIRNTSLDLVCGLQCHSSCLYPSLPACYGQYRHARRLSDSEGKNQWYFPNGIVLLYF